MTVWICLIPFLFVPFFLWLIFFGMGGRKTCPDCNLPLQCFQSPFTKTRRQWLKGGYLCKNCGCESDMAGRKVHAGTAP